MGQNIVPPMEEVATLEAKSSLLLPPPLPKKRRRSKVGSG